MRDRYNRRLRRGEQVVMPEPDGVNDGWSNAEWIGRYQYDKPGSPVPLITVEDCEGDCFDVEPNRVIQDMVEDPNMVIETLISKATLELMQKVGYSFDWVIQTEDQALKAREEGKDIPEEVDWKHWAYIRLWVDTLFEEFIPAKQMVNELAQDDPGKLPLLINSDDLEIQKEVKNALKELQPE